MSHIFDALLKSEAERDGSNGAHRASVNNILTQAEQRASAQWKLKPAEDGTNGKPNDGETSAIATVKAFIASTDPHAIRSAAATERLHSIVAPIEDEEPEITPPQFKTLYPALVPGWKLVSCTDKSSAGAEAFRLLAVRLRHIRRDRPLKKLLITSTVPQEGKSLTSANLASTLSTGGLQRVLLLEGDVHRPSLTQFLRLSQEPGLCDLLQGHSTLEQSAYHLAELGFWILPAGRLPTRRLDLIQSPRMPDLLEQLNESFDWIIVDSPPILPMADTSVLSRLVDGILLVTRRGVTEKRVLEAGLQSLEKSKLIGAVVNSSRKHAGSYYYYGAGATQSHQ